MFVKQLPEAYRSFPRLSSPPGTKASTVCPLQLSHYPMYSALIPVSYTHLRAHETSLHLVCRLLLEKKKKKKKTFSKKYIPHKETYQKHKNNKTNNNNKPNQEEVVSKKLVQR
eukprot:TRINITY_DN3656_c0_g1_i5.p2 TRINITY_DN3656_c0_g1~~TRINITY_DN3656_c0_g1_i5.p2  ORF type:complete len:113 (-),score=23.36 TRINITY_DN3656_c0_g1_i5:8-346(-)